MARASKDFDIADGKLVVREQVTFKDARFERACAKLLEGSEKDILIDLTAVEYLASPDLGVLMGTNLRAKQEGKRLTVRISPQLQRLFDLLRADAVLRIEIARPEK